MMTPQQKIDAAEQVKMLNALAEAEWQAAQTSPLPAPPVAPGPGVALPPLSSDVVAAAGRLEDAHRALGDAYAAQAQALDASILAP